MSNPEQDPPEVIGSAPAAAPAAPVVLPFREVPLGGPRAMRVRRTLPTRERSLIGAWCFIDHYGPDDVSLTGGMRVPGHPHTGLQTVSWLFSGEVEHRDTTGAYAVVRPGQLNLMTAGSGIAHSEFSTPATQTLHGAQLWVALPESARYTAPGFEHYEPAPREVDGARVLVFLGELLGETSPVAMFSPLVGAEITLPPGASMGVPLDRSYEHGLLCDTGTLRVGPGDPAKPGELVYCPAGTTELTLSGAADLPTRLLLLGGTPFDEQIVMWWNFVGRSHEEIVGFRSDWERWRATGSGRYGEPPSQWDQTWPAPALPHVRLRSRG